MELGIRGKSAIVTGASRGIGRAIAIALAQEGVSVAICARNADDLHKNALEIEQQTGGRVLAVAADLSKSEDIKAVVGRAQDTLGPIDILVNNAGSSAFGTFLDLPEQDWEEAIALKYFGYARCMRAVIPDMIRRGGGAILNIIGVGGVQAMPGYTAGGSINAALRLLTKGVAVEMAEHNIRVNAVHPGRIETERIERAYAARAAIQGVSPEEMKRASIAQVPLGRMGQPQEIADAVLFLVSERAGYITGVELMVDGGVIKSI